MDNVEVEIQVNIEDSKPLIDFLKEVNCGKIRRNYVGYPFQLLFPEEVNYEEQ